jgi:hypothetical protein
MGTSKAEVSGLWKKIISDEIDGTISAGHNGDVDEMAADRCGLRYVRTMNDHIQARLGGESGESSRSVDVIRRLAADMMAFEMWFGWRKSEQLPKGKYAIVSLDPYLNSPYRAILFALEVRGPGPKPDICGYAAEIIVQAVQRTFSKTPGRGDVDEGILSLLPGGVEKSWNGAAWTPDSFTCANTGVETGGK